jgi:tetratricopeptide (TPR) repeat protein
MRRPGIVLLLGALAACSRAPSATSWAEEAAHAHQEADRRLDAGDPAGARARLEALVDAQTLSPSADGAQRLALQDTYFRLAQLALAAHDPKQALADADAGLAYGDAPDLFVANLLVARAAAYEAVGDPRAAASDYHRALKMNETLLAQALGRPPR